MPIHHDEVIEDFMAPMRKFGGAAEEWFVRTGKREARTVL